MKTAVVLSGGGAKGAYQIGVWKALRKLGIKYDIVTGTSVGALNGLLMVQQDFNEAMSLWSNIDYSFVFSQNFENIDKNIYLTYIKEFVKNGGMNVTNLENAVTKYFNYSRFSSSDVDYGIVVYNLSKLKEEILTKKDLNQNNIKDFVVASATCYPAFRIKRINNNKYIDGGYYDYLPINVAIDLGADRIIAVDLKAPGVRRRIKDKSKEIISICPNNHIGSFLKFDKFISQKNIKYGYNDTLKKFNKLIGKKFTFYKRMSNVILNKISLKFNKNISDYIEELKLDESLNSRKLQKLVLQIVNHPTGPNIIEIAEYLGETFKLDDSRIYYLGYYNYLIKKSIKKLPKVDHNILKEIVSKKDFDSLRVSKYIVKYMYWNLKKKKSLVDLEYLIPTFNREFLAAIYLISIN